MRAPRKIAARKRAPDRFGARRAGRNIGDHGRAAETKFAARLTPGSGNQAIKGDVRTDAFVIECKATETATLRLQRAWLDTVHEQATVRGKLPALAMQFVDHDGASHGPHRWVAVPEDVFDYLRKLADAAATDDPD